MADLAFSQPERRSYLVPILVALAAIALAAGIAVHFFPATSVEIAEVHTDVVPTATVYKSGTIIVGGDQTLEMMYVVADIRIDNKLKNLIYLNDFSLTLSNQKGEEMTARGVDKRDIPNLLTSFKPLQPMMTKPLLRETAIEPGHSAEGEILIPLQLRQSDWETRKTAILKVDLYHQNPLYLTLSNGTIAPIVKQ